MMCALRTPNTQNLQNNNDSQNEKKKIIMYDFLALEKSSSVAKSHFLSFSTSNMNFLAWDKFFVWAEGRGIINVI